MFLFSVLRADPNLNAFGSAVTATSDTPAISPSTTEPNEPTSTETFLDSHPSQGSLDTVPQDDQDHNDSNVRKRRRLANAKKQNKKAPSSRGKMAASYSQHAQGRTKSNLGSGSCTNQQIPGRELLLYQS